VKAFRSLVLTLAVLAPLSLTPKALAANTLPGVGEVVYDEAGNTLTLAIPYSGRNPYRVLWLNGPKRLVVDIEGLILPAKRQLFIGGGVVEKIRAARFTRTTTRVVFDLAQAADLRAVTDGASHTLQLTIYPLGAQPVSGPAAVEAPAAAPVPAPRATKAPKVSARPAPKRTPQAIPTPEPIARITPVPVETPAPEAPTPVPSFVPTPEAPLPTPAPIGEETPEPLPTPEPAVAQAEFMVFGSRLYAGAELPLSLTESYPAGNSSSKVSTIIPGGVFGWDQMFTPNFGIALGGRAMSYTLEDQANKDAGFSTTHKRDDYSGSLGLRGRIGLPAGLELMLQPGFMLRTTQVANAAAGVTGSAAVNDYLSSSWLGYGPTVGAGLGWHLFGPLSIAGNFDYNYLLAGSMAQANVASIFPLSGMRYGGELRLDFGPIGLTAGYNMTNWSHAGADAANTLTQSWGGPYVKANIIY
jgi:hypothetical protein